MKEVNMIIPKYMDECPLQWQNMIRSLRNKFTNEEWDEIADDEIEKEIQSCGGELIEYDLLSFPSNNEYLAWRLKWE